MHTTRLTDEWTIIHNSDFSGEIEFVKNGERQGAIPARIISEVATLAFFGATAATFNDIARITRRRGNDAGKQAGDA